MKEVAFIASEILPFAKTGGLADVAGALPKYLHKLGLRVRVFMPLYREVKKKALPLEKAADLSTPWADATEAFRLWKYCENGITFHFIDKDEFYDRDHLYSDLQGDYPDNGERFAFFSKAVLTSLRAAGPVPEIIHCHDWQTALVLAYLKFVFSPFFQASRSVFTIHNLAYQGIFPKEILAKIGLPDELFNMEGLEYYGKVSFLKAGILYSTAVTTVSHRYSLEIQTPEFGCGLDGLLRKRAESLFGILNGVDYSAWNPETDSLVKARFQAADPAGKKECKIDLLRSFGLPEEDIPVVGMVTRLAGQKGLDIVCDALEELFKRKLCLVILGTGEEKIESMLREGQKKFPRSLGLRVAFDDRLAHKIVAGSDLFLIPSRYEPCGLTQMYSLRYGTIPVVRATGGLDDTIQEFNPATEQGNGFKFQEYTAGALVEAVSRAVNVFQNRAKWPALVQNAMACDFSWDRSAAEYLKLYRRIYQE